jgi:predicted AlkP superfamily phosphohydrolase/phosphomutase
LPRAKIIVRVVILGLDGATWDLLLPMIEQGKMKNLKQAMETGSWGVLDSTIPPVSPVAWTSLATGKNPGKHGILGFTHEREGRPTPVDSTMVDSPALWDILGQYGRMTVVAGVPVTYPPRPINGCMVTGMLTPKKANEYTHPPQLKDEISGLVGDYSPNPFDNSGRAIEHLEEILSWAKKDERIIEHLIDRCDWGLLMNIVRAPDLVQHWFYDLLDTAHHQNERQEAKDYLPLLDDIYDACDQVIGNRLGLLDGDTLLFIVSDHGFGPATHWFAVNRFLMEIGLLTLEDTGIISKWLRDKLDLSLLAKLDFLGLRYRLANTKALAVGMAADRALSPAPIDWTRTKAYCSTADGLSIRVNLAGREPHGLVQPGEEYEQVRQKLRAELKGLRDPITGGSLVADVHFREEVCDGPHLADIPDVLFSLGRASIVPRPWLSPTRVFQPIWSHGWTGDHRPEGILVAVGPHVRRGTEIAAQSILDVAPTVLASMGLAVPGDMDGKPMEELFEGTLAASIHSHTVQVLDQAPPPPSSAYSEREEQEVLERLRNLGYLE